MWSLISHTPEAQNWTRFKSVLIAVWISKSDLNQTHNCIHFKSNMQAAWNAMAILQHLKKNQLDRSSFVWKPSAVAPQRGVIIEILCCTGKVRICEGSDSRIWDIWNTLYCCITVKCSPWVSIEKEDTQHKLEDYIWFINKSYYTKYSHYLCRNIYII